jgi:hypothetical protein
MDGPHIRFIPPTPDSPAMSDTSAMYRSSVSSATSPSRSQASTASNDPLLEFDRNLFNDAISFTDFNFDFLTSLPIAREIRNDSTASHDTKTAEATQFDESPWQDFPASIMDLNHGSLRSVSTHPVFSQDQVASFQRSFEKRTHRNNDCMTLALQVVNNLSVMRETCMVATSIPTTCTESTKMELRDVDTVLFINRDSVQSIKKILDCTCSSDQAVTLACYLATTKVVEWYGAVIEAVGEWTDESNCSSKDFGHRPSQNIMAERIIARLVYMGSMYWATDRRMSF